MRAAQGFSFGCMRDSMGHLLFQLTFSRRRSGRTCKLFFHEAVGSTDSKKRRSLEAPAPLHVYTDWEYVTSGAAYALAGFLHLVYTFSETGAERNLRYEESFLQKWNSLLLRARGCPGNVMLALLVLCTACLSDNGAASP